MNWWLALLLIVIAFIYALMKNCKLNRVVCLFFAFLYTVALACILFNSFGSQDRIWIQQLIVIVGLYEIFDVLTEALYDFSHRDKDK